MIYSIYDILCVFILSSLTGDIDHLVNVSEPLGVSLSIGLLLTVKITYAILLRLFAFSSLSDLISAFHYQKFINNSK